MTDRPATLAGLLLMAALGAAGPLYAQPAPAWPPQPPSRAAWERVPPVSVERYAVAPVHADPWWARDKLQHLTFSFLWTLGTQYVLVEKTGWSNEMALPVSAGSGATVGLSKELFDWRIGSSRRFSTRDLAADAVGILLAVGVIAL